MKAIFCAGAQNGFSHYLHHDESHVPLTNNQPGMLVWTVLQTSGENTVTETRRQVRD